MTTQPSKCRSILLKWVVTALVVLQLAGGARAAVAPQGDAPHWAFVPVIRPPLPSVSDPLWSENGVDRFVKARLEREGWEPSPEADASTLARRLALDLTGLPPDLPRLERYVANPSERAYRELMEDLLASPHYGERMALDWLDAARYADTNGYSIDGGRHMWRWRDWVIDAFNENMPFDQFTVEQLAGDLLPAPTLEQRIATGFNRNHMITHEGGTILEEYRVAYVADRVRTTATVWMGLTLACAQCHDHKYDPLSQEDYYRFFAYFNNVPERGNDGDGGINSVPSIPVPSAAQREHLAELDTERATLFDQLRSETDDQLARRRAWEESTRKEAVRAFPKWGPWYGIAFSAKDGDLAFDTVFPPERGVTLDAPVGGRRFEPRPKESDGVAHALKAQHTAHYRYRTVDVSDAIDVVLSLGSDDAIKMWHDGALVLDRRVQRGVLPDQERVTLTLHPGRNEILLKIVNYGGPGGYYFKVAEAGIPASMLALIDIPASQRTAPEDEEVAVYFARRDPEKTSVCEALLRIEKEREELLREPETTVMVMAEMPTPRKTFVLMRGAYDQPAAEVASGVPSALPSLGLSESGDRLALARWLVDPRHPLTARVTVNRLWQMIFGVGLVKTGDDFGTQGERPSHPELLDWLASEFVASGFDVRHVLRLILTSRTYRQRSASSEEHLARDPENRLLARGPRFRLAAEFIRDGALASSGLLVPRVGGPSVRPYQPPGLWVEMSHFGSTPATAQKYEQDQGEALFRRGLYTFVKRTVPPPAFAAFDAPNREVCTLTRSRTNTPLQALVLLNDPTFVEAARVLGERMLREGGDDVASRIARGFLLTLSRRPTAAESERLRGVYDRARQRFAADESAAVAFLSVGEAPRTDVSNVAERAAYAMVATVLLNLSETVTKE